MDSKPYDVVLIPEESVANKAIALSERLKKYDTLFTLDNVNFFPHLSSYMLQLNDDGLNKACEELSRIAEETSSIRAIASHYHYEDNYVNVEYVKSPELIAIQTKVLERLNPLRDGMRDKDRARLEEATGETKKNLLNFGYRSVGNLFLPHVTFTRFTEDTEHVVKTFPSKEEFDGNFVSLGIFEMGDNGTCITMITSWDFI